MLTGIQHDTGCNSDTAIDALLEIGRHVQDIAIANRELAIELANDALISQEDEIRAHESETRNSGSPEEREDNRILFYSAQVQAVTVHHVPSPTDVIKQRVLPKFADYISRRIEDRKIRERKFNLAELFDLKHLVGFGVIREELDVPFRNHQ